MMSVVFSRSVLVPAVFVVFSRSVLVPAVFVVFAVFFRPVLMLAVLGSVFFLVRGTSLLVIDNIIAGPTNVYLFHRRSV